MNVSSVRTALFSLLAIGLAGAATGQRSLLTSASPPPPVAASPSTPSTFGTTQTSYRVAIAPQFNPVSSDVTYSYSNDVLRYSTTTNGVFVSSLDLPSGALLTSLEMDACDSNAATSHVIMVLGACAKLGAPCFALSSLLQTVSDTVTPCKATIEDVTPLNHTVNNLTNNYFVEVVTASGDSTNSFAAARVGYKLQVSPASVQTFNDVPPNDFGYQFIEALFASGITGGCQAAPPLYCPDAPVTRRQMAIFIAKALGLQWQ